MLSLEDTCRIATETFYDGFRQAKKEVKELYQSNPDSYDFLEALLKWLEND